MEEADKGEREKRRKGGKERKEAKRKGKRERGRRSSSNTTGERQCEGEEEWGSDGGSGGNKRRERGNKTSVDNIKQFTKKEPVRRAVPRWERVGVETVAGKRKERQAKGKGEVNLANHSVPGRSAWQKREGSAGVGGY